MNRPIDLVRFPINYEGVYYADFQLRYFKAYIKPLNLLQQFEKYTF